MITYNLVVLEGGAAGPVHGVDVRVGLAHAQCKPWEQLGDWPADETSRDMQVATTIENQIEPIAVLNNLVDLLIGIHLCHQHDRRQISKATHLCSDASTRMEFLL